MREKFGFVGGDVDTDRAVAFSSFAGETEIEGLLDFFAAPAVADDRIFSSWALRHLPEQVGAAAGGVFFVARDAVAWAHHAAVFAAAFADADAAQSSCRQAAVIVRELEAG